MKTTWYLVRHSCYFTHVGHVQDISAVPGIVEVSFFKISDLQLRFMKIVEE